MLSDKQMLFFNKAYSAYRDILDFSIKHFYIIKKDSKNPEIEATLQTDIDIQSLLYSVSQFPEQELLSSRFWKDQIS